MNYLISIFKRFAAFAFVLAFIGTAAMAQNNKEKDRIAECEKVRSEFISTNDKMSKFFDTAYGLCAFPNHWQRCHRSRWCSRKWGFV